jgi:pSer/pThr/pTyr-binding forkhead associated (FHA) protein
MFALEITFKGEKPSTETVFIRRPLAVIGADEAAHVIVDEMRSLGYNLLISRDVGRKFTLTPINTSSDGAQPSFLDGVYEGESSVDLGPVKFHFVAIDGDLMLRETEAPDRAGARILRQAATSKAPLYPALIVTSQPRVVVSFSPDQPVLVGRSRQCSLRLDNSAISSRHARVGYEGGKFWVEDLGSSNGTFVNNQQISGRVNIDPGAHISFGKEVTARGVVSSEQASDVSAGVSLSSPKAVSKEKRYPILVSLSESARPAKIVLNAGAVISLGRDPSSDMWLGAPHVSRRHCAVEVTKNGVVRITDCSTNGTAYDGGMLRRDQTFESSDKPIVLDFGGNVTVALCFSEKDEQAFTNAGGSSATFRLPQGAEAASFGKRAANTRSRRTTAWLQTPAELLALGEDTGKRGGLRQLYARLSWQGRLVLGLAAVGLIGVFALVVAILVLGFQR